MIEELFEVARDRCLNCNEPIRLMHGDLTGDRWYHESGGLRSCAFAPQAEPVGEREEKP